MTLQDIAHTMSPIIVIQSLDVYHSHLPSTSTYATDNFADQITTTLQIMEVGKQTKGKTTSYKSGYGFQNKGFLSKDISTEDSTGR